MALWLSEADVRAALDPAELIPAMERALAALSAGEVDQPVRTAIELKPRTFFALMPAYLRAEGVLGAKLVSVIPQNARLKLPTHLAAIALFNAETGELAAVVDGRYITELRTAAVSAVSVRRLAREDAAVVAILGSGVQACSHVAAFRLVKTWRQIRAWSPTPEHLRRFARETDVEATPTAAEAVRGADVVLLATNAVTPAVEDAWVSPGTHVIAIGACRPSQREIDPALVARARLIVDSRAAAFEESGDVVQGIREGRFSRQHVRAELGEVIAGRAPGRTGPREITLFKSLGLAVEDLAAAAIAFRRAREMGRGVDVRL